MYIPPKFLLMGDSGTGKSTSCLSFLNSPYFRAIHVIATQPSTALVWSQAKVDSRVTIHNIYDQNVENDLSLLIKRVGDYQGLTYKSILDQVDTHKRDYGFLPTLLKTVQGIKSDEPCRTVIVLDMLKEVIASVRDCIVGKSFPETHLIFYATQTLALDIISMILRLFDQYWVAMTIHTEPAKNSLTTKTISFIGDKRDNAVISLFSDVLYCFIDKDKSGKAVWLWTNYDPEKCQSTRMGIIPQGTYQQDFSQFIPKYLQSIGEVINASE